MFKTIFQDKSLSYNIQGEGFPLVLLHGYLESKEVWENFIPLLSGYKIIVPDLPGHGQSSVYSNIHEMELLADAVRKILEQENVQKSILLGHSMGGYVAEAFERKYPELVVGLGLIHSTIYADNEEKKRNRLREIEIIKKGKLQVIANNILPNLVATNNQTRLKTQINQLIERAKTFNPDGVIAILNGMRERPEHEIKPNIPILVIGSEYDNFIPLNIYQKMKKDNPSIKLKIIENSGHASFIENPEKCSKAILSFIASAINRDL